MLLSNFFLRAMYSCVIRYEAGCLSSSGGRDMTSWVSRCPDRALVGGCGCLKHTPREAWYIEGSYGFSGVGFLRDDGGAGAEGSGRRAECHRCPAASEGPATRMLPWPGAGTRSVCCRSSAITISISLCAVLLSTVCLLRQEACQPAVSRAPKSRGTYASTPCRSAADPERDAPRKMDDIPEDLFPPLHHHLLRPL
jgi:hypothetical protein